MSENALTGRRVLVTRTREQSSGLAEALRAYGAEVIEVPLIRIEPPESYGPLDEALARIATYDTLLVTSANTARVLGERRPAPWPAQPFTVAVGPATAAALRRIGWRVDLEPKPAVAESVVRALAPRAKGRRMLLARAAVARDLLPDALRNAGAAVDVVDAYRTVPAEESALILRTLFAPDAPPVDAVTFTSSSTAQNFIKLLGAAAIERLQSTAACSIGPITSATLRSLGAEVAVEAATHDVSGLATAVLRLFA